MLSLGELLRQYRQRERLTQEELSERAKLSVRTIRNLESGHVQRPRYSSIRTLADALDLTDRQRAELDCAYDRGAATHDRPDSRSEISPADTEGIVSWDDQLQRIETVFDEMHGDPAATLLFVISGPPDTGKTKLAAHWAQRIATHFPQDPLHIDMRVSQTADEAVRMLLARLGVAPLLVPDDPDARTDLYHDLTSTTPSLVIFHNVLDAGQVRPLLPRGSSCATIITSRNRLADLVARDGSRPFRLELGEPAYEAAERPERRHIPQFQLPTDAGDFTGRDEELRIISSALLQDRTEPAGAVPVVAISGQGGSGKTTLAVHAAHAARAGFPDGQLFTDMHGMGPRPVDPGRVLTKFVKALGVAASDIPQDVDERAEVYRRLLAGRRMLIVLDDVEGERQVRPLLPGTPTCAVLITSRTRLTALEGTRRVDLDVFEPEDAVALFTAVAGHDRVADEPRTMARIVDLCGRLPLAVRIAAARLAAHPHWSLQTLAERLDDEQGRLDELAAGDLEIRSSVALSYHQLSDHQRRLFRRLGLLPALDFPAWLAMPLLDDSSPSAELVFDALVSARLVDAAGFDPTGSTRYRLHDLVRIFALERVQEEERPESLRAASGRVQGALLHLAEHADERLGVGQQLNRTGSSEAPRWLPGKATVERLLKNPICWLETERPLLVAAVRQAVDLEMHAAAWDLACCLSRFLETGWHMDDWQETHTDALAAARAAGDPRGEASVLRAIGEMHLDRDHYTDALGALRESVRIFDGISESLPAAHVHRAIGVACRMLGDVDDATRHVKLALATFRELGDDAGLAGTLQALGAIQKESGRFADAAGSYRTSLGLFRRVGDDLNEAHVLCSLGTLLHSMREISEAESNLCESLSLSLGNEHRFGELYARAHLGRLYADVGRSTEARENLTAALKISWQINDRFGEGLCLYGLGDLSRRNGALAESEDLLTRAISLFEAARLPLWEARALQSLGDVMNARGDVDGARDHWRQAYAVFLRLRAPEAVTLAELVRGP
jgi:tetratricopeptide (TPR) repeat protein/transcriptional regulator with XRE-family HTH domain